MRASEKSVLKRICGSKKENANDSRKKKLLNGKIHNFYFTIVTFVILIIIISVIG